VTGVLAALPWHYWLGVASFVMTLLLLIGFAVQGYRKVVVPTLQVRRWELEQRRRAALRPGPTAEALGPPAEESPRRLTA
jgi:hypothetical protein